ncbi:hypothetical protein M2459_003222 [Parabacteroides sp. PF5-5]|uniref:fimbrillin family protein n=1 Tax=unclassified Parabacteroides TaxID=2649774 RepID=UPI00247343EC|nr:MULTISPECIES: fimbrillin family protein [unclassified Parabacteroides]MDH6306522.1 hypothetical protein [Parabacteroides sp. PH5-39]MDH6317489.1 hypothetical protein [Parabacteroides sp. PF5-13]MDH6321208.1 hypothetical protein [Parabacteroides sp. PH5-13]MDH6324940.1 hypothetical protein [Parabacteroides sp. PH5-8]MDH6328649.1 hypothetical protein [Parabacteroides sp. PH5-41]
MKKYLLSLSTVALLAAMSSCSNEEVIGKGEPKVIDDALISFSKPVVTISQNEESKSAIEDATLPTGGTLGIYAYKGTAPYFTAVYTPGDYTALMESGYMWPGSETVNFYAYFYKGTGVSVTNYETIPYTLNSTWNDQVDLLYAQKSQAKTESTPGTVDPVPLVFNHAMAWIRFNIKSSTNAGVELNSVSFLTKTKAAFSLLAGAFGTASDEATLTLNDAVPVTPDATGGVSTACVNSLLIPTTWTDKDITVTINGAVFAPVKISETFAPGLVYTYTIDYSGKEIQFSADPEITEWNKTAVGAVDVPVE